MPRPAPPGGARQAVHLRLLKAELKRLNKLARAHGLNRSDMMRWLLNQADPEFAPPEREEDSA